MLKKTIVILICLLVINTISSYSETYGIGDSLYGQYTDGKTIYTDKDIEQLANLGTSTIRALLVPTISLFGALQNTLQSPSANASTRNSALNTANLFHLVTSLIAPAIKLATGREVINIDVQKLYDMIQSGQPLQLIDVRTPSEWGQKGLPTEGQSNKK